MANLVKNPCPKSMIQARMLCVKSQYSYLVKDAEVKDYMVLNRPALNNWKGIFGQLEGDIWFGTVLVGVDNGEIMEGFVNGSFRGLTILLEI
jgi:hypothetical protein